MTKSELLVEIDSQINFALSDAIDSSNADQNSYGAGYDNGYLCGLRWARDLIGELPD